MILTPQGDLYIKDLAGDNPDIAGWRVYDPAALRGLVTEGDARAQVERACWGWLASWRGGRSCPTNDPPPINGGNAGLAVALAGGGGRGDPAVDDARTLGISRDETGLRFKEFRSAATECRMVEFQDWPIGL